MKAHLHTRGIYILVTLAYLFIHTNHAKADNTTALLDHLGAQGASKRKTTDRETVILIQRLTTLRDRLKRADTYLGYVKKVSQAVTIVDKAVFVSKNVSLALKPAPAPVNPAATNTNAVLNQIYQVLHPIKEKAAQVTVYTEKVRKQIQKVLPYVERAIRDTTQFQTYTRRFRTGLAFAHRVLHSKCARQSALYRTQNQKLEQFSLQIDSHVNYKGGSGNIWQDIRRMTLNTALYNLNRPLDEMGKYLQALEVAGQISQKLVQWMDQTKLYQVLKGIEVALKPIDAILKKRLKISLNIVLIPHIPRKCIPPKCANIPDPANCKKKICLKKKLNFAGFKRTIEKCKTFPFYCSKNGQKQCSKKLCIKKKVKWKRWKKTFHACKTVSWPCRRVCSREVCTREIKGKRFTGSYTNSLQELLKGADAGIKKVKTALIAQAKKIAKQMGIDASKFSLQIPNPGTFKALANKLDQAKSAAQQITQILDTLGQTLDTLKAAQYAKVQRALQSIPKISCSGSPLANRPVATNRPPNHPHKPTNGRFPAAMAGWKQVAGMAIHCLGTGCIRSGPACNTSIIPGQCAFPLAQAQAYCSRHPACKSVTCLKRNRYCFARRHHRLAGNTGFISYYRAGNPAPPPQRRLIGRFPTAMVGWKQAAGMAIHCLGTGCIRSGPACNTSIIPGQCAFPLAQAQAYCSRHPACKSVTCLKSKGYCFARRHHRLAGNAGFVSYYQSTQRK